MLFLSKITKVIFYLILLFADLFLWFILMKELKGRNRILRISVLLVKATISALFILLFFRITLHRGEFADPANAFRHLQMGTVAVLLVSSTMACLAVTVLIWFISLFRKRKFSGTGLASTVLFIIVLLLMADGYFRQRLDIRTVRQEISIPGLDPALEGMKMILISDIHISSWHDSYGKLDRAMRSISEEKPDLLFNTGDFITFGWQEFGESDTLLRKAKATAGAFAVPGNHDDGTYYRDYDEKYGAECRAMVIRQAEASGYTFLTDSAVVINHRGKEIAIAGVVTHGHRLDISYGDFEKVLTPLPDSLFTILLLHDPAGWLMSAVSGKMPDLTVAGHTHGFQFGLPGIGWSPSALIQERWKGFYQFRNSSLYVTSGLGTMGMAARFFMPPEIVILTITAG